MSLLKLMEDPLERNKIQKMLDDFCELTGLAAVVDDVDGNPLTDLVNVSEYCREMRTKEGLCCLSDSMGANVAVNTGATCIYVCHAGVVDLAIPLFINGKHEGSIMAGQVRSAEKPAYDFTTEETKRWMADSALNQKYLQLPVMDEAQIERCAKVLEIMRSYIVQRIENIYKLHSSEDNTQEQFLEKINVQMIEVVETIERLNYQIGLEKLDTVIDFAQSQVTSEMVVESLIELFMNALNRLGLTLPSLDELSRYEDWSKKGGYVTSEDLYRLYDWVFDKLLINKYSRVRDDLDYAVAYIQRYYYKKLTVGEVATYMNYSSDYFSRRFKKRFGISYSDYVISYRIMMAKRLLTTSDESIQWIAFSVGFGDAGYFTRVFKKHVGISPTVYRRNC